MPLGHYGDFAGLGSHSCPILEFWGVGSDEMSTDLASLAQTTLDAIIE